MPFHHEINRLKDGDGAANKNQTYVVEVKHRPITRRFLCVFKPKIEVKSRAFTNLTLDANAATHGFYKSSTYRQPEPGSTVDASRRFLRLGEVLKELRLSLKTNTDPAVDD